MAEFLIKAVSATHSDPVKDERGCYKRGDIVVVAPNTHVWGARETLPRFVQVRVSDVGVAAALKYIESQIDNGIVIRRRLYRIRWDDLPAGVKQQLIETGRYETTWDAIKQYVQNKFTGLNEG
jgi:hypothetical protein